MNRIRFVALWALIVTAALIPIRARAQDGRVIRANTATSGSVVVHRGNLDVYGTVRGNATVLRGDIIVHRGGRVRGNAIAVRGTVDLQGGVVDGRIRHFRPHTTRQVYVRHIAPGRHSAWRSIGVAAGWIVVVGLAGFALLAFGADKLSIVINTMQQGVGKSLGSGLLGHLAIVPAAVAVTVLLAASIVGILVIPLGLMAFMILVAGLGMFGFVAAATMTGVAITGGKSRDATPNGALLRAFVTGSAIYLGMWLVAASLSGIPLVGAMVCSFVSAVTFVAVTTGFGAVLLSWWRGEFKRPLETAA